MICPGPTVGFDAAATHVAPQTVVRVFGLVGSATAVPAAVLGLSDEVGGLRRGLSADLLVTNPGLTPVRVMRKGVWLGAADQW